MKFTRKFLDGYITYDEDDVIVHANSFLGYIFKSIVAIIYGTILGVIFTIISVSWHILDSPQLCGSAVLLYYKAISSDLS